MLQVLNEYSNIFSKEFLNLLKIHQVFIKKSQFYRYIDSLEEYNLIKIQKWIVNQKGRGYLYSITPKGKLVLKFIQDYFG